MFKKISTLVAVVLCLSLSNGCEKTPEIAATKAAASVQVLNPRIRALPPGQKVTALYLQIKNNSSSAFELIGAESNISQFVEIHQHTNVDGMMKMREVPFVEIAAKSTLEFKPGGYHIMLINLQRELTIGDSADVILLFKDGSKLTIKAEVKHIELQ